MEPTTHHLPRRLPTATGNAPQDPNPPGQATATQITASLTQPNEHTAGADQEASGHTALLSSAQLSSSVANAEIPGPALAIDPSAAKCNAAPPTYPSLGSPRRAAPCRSLPPPCLPSCLGVRG
uniref:Uncharacterized protein n=1 Tax=Oryza brachyantha TaxID=4533 RepID=J3L3V9_ORYBR